MVGMFRAFVIMLLLIPMCFAFAIEYPYKKVDDFKTLEAFKSIEEFEATINTIHSNVSTTPVEDLEVLHVLSVMKYGIGN